MNILGKRAGSISAIASWILLRPTIQLGLFLIGAEVAMSAPPTAQNPSIPLEEFTGFTSSLRPGLLVLIGAFVLIGVTPWGRIVQAARKKK